MEQIVTEQTAQYYEASAPDECHCCHEAIYECECQHDDREWT